MSLAGYSRSFVAACFAVALAACGGGGEGGGSVPTAPTSLGGGSDGSQGAPVDLGVVSAPIIHNGSVGPAGRSYYRFTTGSTAGVHSISLTNTRSDLSWDLTSSSYALITACDNVYAAGNETCSTAPLSANTVYYLSVTEWELVAATYVLTVSPPASTPVANAGPNQSVKTGALITLDGAGSTDPNGDALTYSWSFSSRPNGSAAVLTNPTTLNPTFTPDVDGLYTAALVVSDGTASSPPDTVSITAATFNSAPVASAGAEQHIAASSAAQVTLDGSASSDADGDVLTYSWTLVAPAGSSATLSGSTSATPTFTADAEGTYTATLVVNDGTVDSPSVAVKVNGHRPIDALAFRVIDAEYSTSLNKIVMVAAAPANQLHIYDPVARTNTAVNLNLVPTSVSVSPDGLYAAVGHNGWVSYVDLSAALLVKVMATTAQVSDLVLAGNGYVYAFPRIDQWVEMRSIKISTEQETLSQKTIYAGTRAKLHPGGTAIYGANVGLSPSDIEKYDISAGAATVLYDSPYHGDYAMCGDLWMAEDGVRIFTRCGNVFRSSPNRLNTVTSEAEDMSYSGSLEGVGLIRHLSHSQAIGKVAVIPDNMGLHSDREARIFNYDFLTFASKVTLPHFVLSPTGAFAGHGRYVFYNSTGTKYFVVLQADSTSGMLNDFGVVTY